MSVAVEERLKKDILLLVPLLVKTLRRSDQLTSPVSSISASVLRLTINVLLAMAVLSQF